MLFRRRRKGKVQMTFLVMMVMAMTMMRKKRKKKSKKETQTMHKPATRIRNKSNNNNSSRSINNTNARVQKFSSQLMHGNLAIQLGVERMFEWDLYDRSDSDYLYGSSSSRRTIILIRLTRKKEVDPGISSVLISRMLVVYRRM